MYTGHEHMYENIVLTEEVFALGDSLVKMAALTVPANLTVLLPGTCDQENSLVASKTE